jgi:hypothetical protein
MHHVAAVGRRGQWPRIRRLYNNCLIYYYLYFVTGVLGFGYWSYRIMAVGETVESKLLVQEEALIERYEAGGLRRRNPASTMNAFMITTCLLLLRGLWPLALDIVRCCFVLLRSSLSCRFLFHHL